MSAKLNVLVYSGPGAAPLSTNQALLTLRSLLEPAYSVSTVTPQAILREPWAPTCAALVLPGGADLGYCRSLDGEGTRIVADYVRRGGAYLGLCAGGYFGSGRCEFEVGGGRKDLEVIGRRELAFFPAACRGGAFRGFDYNSEAGVRAARLGVTGENEEEEVVVYWNGGGVFVDAEAMADKGVEVLARYLDQTDVDGGKAAIVHCRIGQGNVVLTGPHPEFNPHLLQPDPDVPNHAALIATMIRHDRSRLRLMKLCLARLGLVSADEPAPIPNPSELYWSALQPADARELPLALTRQGGMVGEPPVLSDGGNDIRFWTMAGSESGDEEAAPTWRRRGQDGAAEAAETAVLGRPLDLVVCRDGWPSAAETARWDHGRYFESLRSFQTVDLASSQVVDPDDFCRWGSPLLYGDVVTSTNTILEKNTRLLSLAKTGTTFAAGAQIAGRGRGSNAWISPEGSLIFSIVIHHPARLAASRPVVFVQYIAAVAVAEAARMYGQGLGDGGEAGAAAAAAAELYEAVPVRLKWPNDIYALKTAPDDEQQQQPTWVKIGGILSSCSLSGDGFQIVLGIGINTNNARPTTSLSALVPAHAAAAAPAYRTERLLARIVTRLGVLYGRFLRDGFAGDLQARYYRYWLHTGQVVTVDEEVVASMSTSGYDGWGAGGGGRGSGRGGGSSSGWRGRVVGVTNDWGLLRVQEEGTGREWALQSDENSFDFWKGLVRRKI